MEERAEEKKEMEKQKQRQKIEEHETVIQAEVVRLWDEECSDTELEEDTLLEVKERTKNSLLEEWKQKREEEGKKYKEEMELYLLQLRRGASRRKAEDEK